MTSRQKKIKTGGKEINSSDHIIDPKISIDHDKNKEISTTAKDIAERFIKDTRVSRKRGVSRSNDAELNWVGIFYPEYIDTLRSWVDGARSWFASGTKPHSKLLRALAAFIEHYLLAILLPRGLAIDVNGFLSPSNPRQNPIGRNKGLPYGGHYNLERDDSWPLSATETQKVPTFFEILCINSKTDARAHNNKIHDFLNYILREKLNALKNIDGRLITSEGLHNPIPYIDADGRIHPVRINRRHDLALTWVIQQRPELSAWQALAKKWLDMQRGDQQLRLTSFSKFFDYLLQPNMLDAVDPGMALSRSTHLPEFFDVLVKGGKGIGARTRKGGATTANIIQNNTMADFIDWVLLSDENGFSEVDEHGRRQVSPAFHNFVSRRSLEGKAIKHDSSVRQALPYGFIHEAKRILIQGQNFRDWTWAQKLLGAGENEVGRPGTDWYEVPEGLIDEADPDCVFERRTLMTGRTVLRMWSPVRYVAIAIKLMLPLRTMQVRVLDSGEADTWRFDPRSNNWVINSSKLAQGNKKTPLSLGAISRWEDALKGEIGIQLYINTNKTNDRYKEGAIKGYHTPWPRNTDILEDVYYWLTKMRNWQEKYNPIRQRTSWTELQGKGVIQEKDLGTLASYAETCFLFRTPEVIAHPHLPVKDGALVLVWSRLLHSLQERLAQQGTTHSNGSPIELVQKRTRTMFNKDYGKHYLNEQASALFDLHGLRVSLITCLAWDGQVPFEILQKLVGHSRLLMTLYYYKPGQHQIHQVLQAAQERLNAQAQKSIIDWLKNGEHKDLENRAIAVNLDSVRRLIPINPANRNIAGWMEMTDGVCLAGGNTSTDEVNASTPGCHNGGPNLGNPQKPIHGEVPGGARNCPRCRWFVTEPHHLPALVARFNNTAFHFDQAGIEVAKHSRELDELRKRRADAETAGSVFTEQSQLKSKERLLELHIRTFDDRCHDLGAIWKLVKRAIDILNSDVAGKALILATDMTGLEVAIEEPEGELLQLAWVCENAEIYPDLNPGTAILRRTQLLDLALERDGLPTAFMRLSPDEQLKVGNAFMRRLSERMNPEDRWIGMRKVVEHMEAGRSLIGLPGVHDALQAVVGTSATLVLRGSNVSLGMSNRKTQ